MKPIDGVSLSVPKAENRSTTPLQGMSGLPASPRNSPTSGVGRFPSLVKNAACGVFHPAAFSPTPALTDGEIEPFLGIPRVIGRKRRLGVVPRERSKADATDWLRRNRSSKALGRWSISCAPRAFAFSPFLVKLLSGGLESQTRRRRALFARLHLCHCVLYGE